MQHKDIVIVGGGPIGYTAAIHLAANGIPATILDDESKSKTVTERVLALSYASYAYLNSLGVWPKDAACASKIEQVHISHDGFGRSIISAKDVQLPSLGFTIKYSDLMAMLREQVLQNSAITVKNCCVTEVDSGSNYATIQYIKNNNESSNTNACDIKNKLIPDFLTANLAIVAEGGNLSINGIEYTHFDYKQMAIVATLDTQNKARNMAYERFSNDGAFVLLPYNSRFMLVWSVDNTNTNVDRLPRSLNADDLTNRLSKNKFFARFGQVKCVGAVHTFPLYKRVAKTKALDSVVIIGNSAQTLHPVSAQGLNLGLRDVRILCENFDEIKYKQCFDQLRKSDTKYIVDFTHNLAKFVDLDLKLVQHLRGVGIVLLSNFKPLQNKIGNDLIFGI